MSDRRLGRCTPRIEAPPACPRDRIGQGKNFRWISPNHSNFQSLEKRSHHMTPVSGGTHSYRIQNYRFSEGCRPPSGSNHGREQIFRNCAHIQHQPIGTRRHLFHLACGMGHYRRCAHGQQNIGSKTCGHMLVILWISGFFSLTAARLRAACSAGTCIHIRL